MTVGIYKSTDASAPILRGQVGSLIALLDACLVNGYGSKVAAGWTKPFSGTNLAVYRMTTSGATGFYLNVDDNAQGTSALAREARLRGFETKTGTDTGTSVSGGTGPFPTVAQAAGGIIVLKSETADATARPWVLLADNKSFYLFTLPGNLVGYSGFHFGDIFSLQSPDPYRCIIIGRELEEAPAGTLALMESRERLADLALLSATASGHFLARNYLAPIQQSVPVGKHSGDLSKRGLVVYPNPAGKLLLMSQFWIHEDMGGLACIRGRLRGVWDFLHPIQSNVNDGDTFSGSGPLAGKSFLVLKPTGEIMVAGASSVASAVQMFILEISDTWETSA